MGFGSFARLPGLAGMLTVLGICFWAANEGHASTRAQQPGCGTAIVQTTSGKVCGVLKKTNAGPVRAYLGIPYAQSPAGANRWKPPIPITPSDTVIAATEFGPACPQKRDKDSPYRQSEDCLSLNIWAPEKAHNRPVMVFIHGGAFIEGTSAEMLYGGQNIAARGEVVVVTLNYRLGALGFLAGIEGLTGNYGFLDQQLALRWVQENIAAFGGNLGNVTLFGESAGAMSIGLHLVSPESQPHFHAAIMQSNPYGLPFRSLDMSNRAAASLRRDIGCSGNPNYALDCMRQAPLHDIIKYQSSVGVELEGLLTGMADLLQWAPLIDRANIPHQPVKAEISKPVIIGTNALEGMAFAGSIDKKMGHISQGDYRAAVTALLDGPSARAALSSPLYAPRPGDNSEVFGRLATDYIFNCAARHVLSRAKAPAHGYLFDHEMSYIVWPDLPFCALPTGRFAPCHTAELPIVFGNPYTLSGEQHPQRHSFTPQEQALSNQIIDYWTHFATHHDLAKAKPEWPRHPATQVFDTNVSMAPRGLGDHCNFWDQFGYAQTGIFTNF